MKPGIWVCLGNFSNDGKYAQAEHKISYNVNFKGYVPVYTIYMTETKCI